MNLLITLEHRFDRTPDGAVWTQTGFSHVFWQRYLAVFDHVRVLARVREVHTVPPDWRRADGDGVSFVPVPCYVGPWQYLRRWRAVRDPAGRAAMEQRTGRTAEGVLLGDLGRADVQAFLLYRLRVHPDEYDLAWGRTYAGDLAILVPRTLWPARPPTKVKEGTELQHGRGTWRLDSWSSSRVYGLAGEAMLNFGPLAVPLAFATLGAVVGAVRRGYRRWSERDARRLLLPLLINLCFVILASDVDNIVFFLVKNGAVPALVVWLASHRHHVERLREASDVEEPKFPMRDVTRGAK